MLKVQIVKDGSAPFNFNVSAESIGLADDMSIDGSKFIDNIEIIGELVDVGKLFNAKGIIKCRKSFVCDRCLSKTVKNQVHEFNEEVDVNDIDDGIVDFTEMIRDILIASQPMKNLCKEDCKGLCPNCGKNLNEGDCGCDRFIVDPRLAALKDFLQGAERQEV